jgi:hypothetical protein
LVEQHGSQILLTIPTKWRELDNSDSRPDGSIDDDKE